MADYRNNHTHIDGYLIQGPQRFDPHDLTHSRRLTCLHRIIHRGPHCHYEPDWTEDEKDNLIEWASYYCLDKGTKRDTAFNFLFHRYAELRHLKFRDNKIDEDDLVHLALIPEPCSSGFPLEFLTDSDGNANRKKPTLLIGSIIEYTSEEPRFHDRDFITPDPTIRTLYGVIVAHLANSEKYLIANQPRFEGPFRYDIRNRHSITVRYLHWAEGHSTPAATRPGPGYAV